MAENNLNHEASGESIGQREIVSELEPVILADVTAVTGASPLASDDGDNIVWGTI